MQIKGIHQIGVYGAEGTVYGNDGGNAGIEEKAGKKEEIYFEKNICKLSFWLASVFFFPNKR